MGEVIDLGVTVVKGALVMSSQGHSLAAVFRAHAMILAEQGLLRCKLCGGDAVPSAPADDPWWEYVTCDSCGAKTNPADLLYRPLFSTIGEEWERLPLSRKFLAMDLFNSWLNLRATEAV